MFSRLPSAIFLFLEKKLYVLIEGKCQLKEKPQKVLLKYLYAQPKVPKSYLYKSVNAYMCTHHVTTM